MKSRWSKKEFSNYITGDFEVCVTEMLIFDMQTGEICLDILKNAWSPAWTLQSVCRAIIALMAHPEPDSPLNCDSGIHLILILFSRVMLHC